MSSSHLIFSNLDGSSFPEEFVDRATGRRRRASIYSYGALHHPVRTVVMMQSYGKAVHLGITIDKAVVKDHCLLASALHDEVAACMAEGVSTFPRLLLTGSPKAAKAGANCERGLSAKPADRVQEWLAGGSLADYTVGLSKRSLPHGRDVDVDW